QLECDHISRIEYDSSRELTWIVNDTLQRWSNLVSSKQTTKNWQDIYYQEINQKEITLQNLNSDLTGIMNELKQKQIQLKQVEYNLKE
ncbi:hypothetical protein GJ496_006197, partial [Pomphorhynchus laevis]